MIVLSVDLASKHSAACVNDGTGVLAEFDTTDLSAFQFAAKLAKLAGQYNPDLVLIEDVPYGIKSQAMTKPVTRLQGVLFLALHRHFDKILMLNPSTWQKEYPGVARAPKGMSKVEGEKFRIEAARKAAEERGYSPPDLVGQYVASLPEGTKVLKKHTNPLEKAMTDYVDAFLISDWALGLGSFEAVASQPSGVQPPMI